MKVVKTYIADDGATFSNEWECVAYEEKLRSKKFKDTALLFDSEGNRLPLTGSGFEESYFILAKTDEAAQYLHDEFRDWDNPWDYEKKEIAAGCWFFTGDKWVDVEVYLEIAKAAERIMNM